MKHHDILDSLFVWSICCFQVIWICRSGWHNLLCEIPWHGDWSAFCLYFTLILCHGCIAVSCPYWLLDGGVWYWGWWVRNSTMQYVDEKYMALLLNKQWWMMLHNQSNNLISSCRAVEHWFSSNLYLLHSLPQPPLWHSFVCWLEDDESRVYTMQYVDEKYRVLIQNKQWQMMLFNQSNKVYIVRRHYIILDPLVSWYWALIFNQTVFVAFLATRSFVTVWFVVSLFFSLIHNHGLFISQSLCCHNPQPKELSQTNPRCYQSSPMPLAMIGQWMSH
jgi:hypothetical protein